MKQNKKKPLTFGALVAGSYRARGKRRAGGIIRLALELRFIQFRGQRHFVLS